ncbi:MAG: hypothetical protein Q8Q32_03310 [bacterium]|nr:hypothetical protein [bacterium]
MYTLKELIGSITIILVLVAYFPYFYDIFKGKTKPHIFSWFIWAVITGIIFALQVSDGAGPGAWSTLGVAILASAIFLLSFKNGHKDIRKVDVLFLITAVLTIPLWLLAKQPVLSIILLSAIDMLGFLPTVRKSWNLPHSETLFLYAITAIRHALAIVALNEYSIVTWLFPVTWTIANTAFSIMLITRRTQLKNAYK